MWHHDLDLEPYIEFLPRNQTLKILLLYGSTHMLKHEFFESQIGTPSSFLIEESPFFILQLSQKFTFRPKCFIWYKIDPKLCLPAQPHGSADFLVYSHVNGSIPSSTTPHRHLWITRPTAPTVLREKRKDRACWEVELSSSSLVDR